MTRDVRIGRGITVVFAFGGPATGRFGGPLGPPITPFALLNGGINIGLHAAKGASIPFFLTQKLFLAQNFFLFVISGICLR